MAHELRDFLTWFKQQHDARTGGDYLIRWPQMTAQVKPLLAHYGRTRLETMTGLLLATPNKWIADSDRGVGMLVKCAEWLAQRAPGGNGHGTVESFDGLSAIARQLGVPLVEHVGPCRHETYCGSRLQHRNRLIVEALVRAGAKDASS